MIFSLPPAHKRALLIFNPTSGIPGESPAQLVRIISEMQAHDIIPEVYLVQPENHLQPVIKDALRRHIRLFVVSGGDGTVNSVAVALAGTHATLGVIPTGTRNNVALSLGIPQDIPEAVAILREGRRVRVDMGVAAFGNHRQHFLEACSVGLFSALFPSADEIQHGNLAAIGDFISTLFASPPADMRLVLDQHQTIETQGHVVVIGNMPFIGPNYPIAGKESYIDGLLDVLLFANITKLGLIGTAVQMASGTVDDPRIQRYQVRDLQIFTNPPMPILADGFPLGEGPLRISVQRHALAVMAALPAAEEPEPDDFTSPGEPPVDKDPTASGDLAP